MPIAFEGGRRGGDASFGRRGQCHATAAAGACGGSSSSGRGSDSRAAVVQWDEGDDNGDGEVQSSYRGPFDTMDALQDALPNNRRGVSKFYNGKSSSVLDVADAVSSPQPAKSLANPGNPSPKKRKGFLPFGFSWNKSRSKESISRGGVTNSPKSCRKTLSPAVTSCNPRSSRSNNEHEHCQDPPRHCLQRGHNAMGASASPPTAALRSQLVSVQMQSVSVAGVQDVSESTTSVSPREKRRKSLQ
ncbi:protein OXIDATIVE STRESS 3 LIKE 1-like [Phragmites australis]|uniref:protein OXIDATIVE STRESS 3 LIKE 1-like n=1 Tax=Phragmites australis TaxID=29695 RepID=UPI002D79D8FF|nr:protein OXIDATIVE STRESS 3 LIKE 1-like [Phragmites australis]